MTPTDVKLHQASRVLELVFPNGRRFRLPYELLRVHSPSAEVRGHGPGQETLQVGKREVDRGGAIAAEGGDADDPRLVARVAAAIRGLASVVLRSVWNLSGYLHG